MTMIIAAEVMLNYICLLADVDSNGRSKIIYGPPSSLPALTTKVPSSWTKIEGNYIELMNRVVVELVIKKARVKFCYIDFQANSSWYKLFIRLTWDRTFISLREPSSPTV